MAGDWIPMRKDLWDCPEVVRILSATCPQNVRSAADKMRRKCEVVGALFKTWSIFDTFSEDGTLAGYDAESLNEMVGVENWAENLQHVGWLVIGEGSLEMPSFTTYLSKSAKRRMKDAERKNAVRKVSAKCPQNVRNDADKKRTTEQNRTEQKSIKRNIDEPKVRRCFSDSFFDGIWAKWRKHRSEKQKPLGDIEEETQLMDLSRHGEPEAVAMVDFTIRCGAVNLITNGNHKATKPEASQKPQNASRFSLKDIPI